MSWDQDALLHEKRVVLRGRHAILAAIEKLNLTKLPVRPLLLLDDSRQPVDKDVFMRALRYHEIRSGETHPEGATTGSRQNAAAESGAAQSTAARRR